MHYAPGKDPCPLPFSPFKACTVPRPIGWLSTISTKGVVNLAPYSQWQNLTFDPTMVMFAANQYADGRRKHTVVNAEETGWFVWNMCTYDLREAMNITAMEWPEGTDEFEKAGVTKAPCIDAPAPRVAASQAHFECKYLSPHRLVARELGAWLGGCRLRRGCAYPRQERCPDCAGQAELRRDPAARPHGVLRLHQRHRDLRDAYPRCHRLCRRRAGRQSLILQNQGRVRGLHAPSLVLTTPERAGSSPAALPPRSGSTKPACPPRQSPRRAPKASCSAVPAALRCVSWNDHARPWPRCRGRLPPPTPRPSFRPPPCRPRSAHRATPAPGWSRNAPPSAPPATPRASSLPPSPSPSRRSDPARKNARHRWRSWSGGGLRSAEGPQWQSHRGGRSRCRSRCYRPRPHGRP